MSTPSAKTFTLNYIALSSSNLPPGVNSGTPSNCCPSTGCNSFPYSNLFDLSGLYELKVQDLNGETISNILNDPKYFKATVTSLETIMTGTHYYDCSEGSIVNLILLDNLNRSAAAYNFTDIPGGDFSSTSNISINEILTNPPLLSGYNLSLNTNGAGCCRYAFVLNLIFTITIEVQFCVAERLEDPRCLNYCLIPENLTSATCFPQYFNFCLNTNNSNGDPNIVTSIECQDFFKNYIQNKGPDSRIDSVLQKYCSKYAGFEDLLNTKNQAEIDLCACNLDKQLYQNLRNSLISFFPGYEAVAEDARCLFPECVDSPYKNTNTTAICQIPNCVNIVGINNNGQINGGVTIIQGATGCQTITGQGGTGATGPTGTNLPQQKTWWEKNWLWVVLGVGIFIVLIIIILVIIAGESNKKKPKVTLYGNSKRDEV